MTTGRGGWPGRALISLALMALLGWPLASLAGRALSTPEMGAGIAEATGPARGLGLAAETVRLVFWTEVLVLPIGVGLAWLLGRTDLPGRGFARGVIWLLLLVPLPLQALVWLGSFGNLGRQQAWGGGPFLVGVFGAATVHAIAVLPWVVLIAGRGWRAAEPELEEAARLEVTPGRAWRLITLRRAWPSIVAAAVFVAATTAGEMTVTDLIPLRTYAEEAYTLAQQGLEPAGLAIRATLPQVLIAVPLVLVLGLWLSVGEPERRAGVHRGHFVWRLGWMRGVLGVIVGVGSVLLIALPAYGLIWRAGRVGSLEGGLRWSWGGLVGTLGGAWLDLADPELPWAQAPLWGTLLWSGLGASGAVVLAWNLAWLGRRSRTWMAVSALVLAVTLAIPAPIVGLMLKMAYVSIGWMNATPALLVMALVVRTVPFVMLLIWPAVRGVPEAWVDGAALEGFGFWSQARRVGWPATRDVTAGAWLVAFALGLGELPAAYFVRAPGYEPLSSLVWSLLHVGVESRLAGIGLILMGLAGVIGLATWWMGRLSGRRGARLR